MDNYKTILTPAEAGFTEKRSGFVGIAMRAQDEAQIRAALGEAARTYPEASHHAYAYALRSENRARFSDGGEPASTAGKPILDVISKRGLADVLVIVVRYFGGIKLGAGGLTRAYARAAALALDAAGEAACGLFYEAECVCSYSDYEKFARAAAGYGVITDKTSYGEAITVNFALRAEYYEEFAEKLKNITNGEAKISKTGERFEIFNDNK